MLTDKQLQDIAKRAGLDSKDLISKLRSESEETLEFEQEGEFITHEELDSIKERAGKDSYKEGKKAGEEMRVKELKEKYGVEFEGKTADALAEALKEKFTKEAKTQPEKRVQELQSDNDKLRALVTEKENELETTKTEFTKKLNTIEIESVIKSKLPDKLANGLTREDAYILYKARRGFQKSDSGIELLDPQTGQVMKNKKLEPISIDSDIEGFLSQFGQVDTGRGNGDEPPKPRNNFESFTKRSELDDYFEKNNTPLSERSVILAKAMKNEGFKISE